MEDRDVQYPDYFKITKVEGTDDIFKVTPAPGEVNKEGSLVNKSLLFDDVVAGLFELYGVDATPNKAFEYLGKFNLHWWKRRALASSYTEVKTEKPVNSLATGDTGDFIIRLHDDSGANNVYSITADLKYSDKINIDQSNGEITLVSPKTISGINARSVVSTELSAITGKYVQSKTVKKNGGTVDNGIYLIPDVMPEKIYSGLSGTVMWGAWTDPMYKITSKKVIDKGNWEYIFSDDRSAYPDSGEQDGYEYQYLGVPFENLPDMPKIEMGSYVGNGKYGKSNPNSLTFSFIPKFWGILTSYEPGVPYDRFRPIPDRILLPWGETLKNPTSGNEEMVIPSYDGNKVSWYSNRGQDTQCSSNNYVYYYFAIA